MNIQESIICVGNRLERLEVRMEKLDTRVSHLEECFSSLDTRVSHLEECFSGLDARVVNLESGMRSMQEQMSAMDERLASLEVNVREMRVILEHETNRKLDALFDGREDELRYRDLLIIHDKQIEQMRPRLSNIEIAYSTHLKKYHMS